MRILIVGKSNKAKILTDYFALNPDHLVFTTYDIHNANGETLNNESGNFIDIMPDNVPELREFALANDINLTIVCDDELMELDFNSDFSSNNLAILSPEPDAIRMALSKASGKKFIYKNKIKTPKFAIFEKPQLAIEYVRNTKFPLVIKPDKHYAAEGVKIVETYNDAKNYIEKLFETGNKRIVIEDYILGKEVSFYVLVDGFNPVILGVSKSYLDIISMNDADIDNSIKDSIYNEAILPLIRSVAADGYEYIGILGFDFIIDFEGNFYLIECNTFFKELDTAIIPLSIDENLPALLMSAIDGTMLEKYSKIKQKNIYMASFIDNGKITTVESASKNMLREKILIEGFSENDLNEAYKLWKI